MRKEEKMREVDKARGESGEETSQKMLYRGDFLCLIEGQCEVHIVWKRRVKQVGKREIHQLGERINRQKNPSRLIIERMTI